MKFLRKLFRVIKPIDFVDVAVLAFLIVTISTEMIINGDVWGYWVYSKTIVLMLTVLLAYRIFARIVAVFFRVYLKTEDANKDLVLDKVTKHQYHPFGGVIDDLISIDGLKHLSPGRRTRGFRGEAFENMFFYKYLFSTMQRETMLFKSVSQRTLLVATAIKIPTLYSEHMQQVFEDVPSTNQLDPALRHIWHERKKPTIEMAEFKEELFRSLSEDQAIVYFGSIEIVTPELIQELKELYLFATEIDGERHTAALFYIGSSVVAMCALPFVGISLGKNTSRIIDTITERVCEMLVKKHKPNDTAPDPAQIESDDTKSLEDKSDDDEPRDTTLH